MRHSTEALRRMAPPDDAEPMLQLATVLLDAGEFGRAEDLLHQLTEHTGSPMPEIILAVLLENRGDPTAGEYLRRAAKKWDGSKDLLDRRIEGIRERLHSAPT